MRVFVTGGSGFVGSHLVVELISRGHEMTVLTREPARVPPGSTAIAGDLLSWKPDVSAFDALIHNAVVWDDQKEDAWIDDVVASAGLFVAAEAQGVSHIIYTSSAAVHRPFQEGMTEEQCVAPVEEYGRAKHVSEQLLNAIGHRSGIAWHVLRPGPVVGPPAHLGGPHRSDRRIAEFVRCARGGENLHYGVGGRQLTPASGLAKLYGDLLDAQKPSGTYICVSEEKLPWERIARRVVELSESESELLRDGEPWDDGSFEVSKLRRDFGTSLDCERALDEHIQHLLNVHS